jgi:hypothetical protein
MFLEQSSPGIFIVKTLKSRLTFVWSLFFIFHMYFAVRCRTIMKQWTLCLKMLKIILIYKDSGAIPFHCMHSTTDIACVTSLSMKIHDWTNRYHDKRSANPRLEIYIQWKLKTTNALTICIKYVTFSSPGKPSGIQWYK